MSRSQRQFSSRVASIIALLSASVALPVQAEAVVSLIDRFSESNVQYKGIFETGYYSGGTTTPVTSLTDDLSLTLSGSFATTGSAYGYKYWDYQVSWALDQSFDYVGQLASVTQISGQGITDVSMDYANACHVIDEVGCHASSATITGLNSQALTFSISEATDYTITGSASGGEAVFLQTWVESDGKWHSIEHFMSGYYTVLDFDQTDTLDAGLYRVINSLDSFTADPAPQTQLATWSYTMTFPSAVPEPQTWAMLLAGLCVVYAGARNQTRVA
jgi:hypothetical protein